MGVSRGYVSESRGHRPARSSSGPKADILIDNNGHACLSDFSIVAIAAGQSVDISSWTTGGTIQWMSPELIDPESFGLEKVRPTKESDCYALGMVIYEVLSGRTPFAPRSPFFVIQKVLNGERPGRPQEEGGTLFTDCIWEILELCWKHKPGERISAKDILPRLEQALSLSQPSSRVDGVMGSDAGGQLNATTSDSGVFPVRLRSMVHLQSSLWRNRTVDRT